MSGTAEAWRHEGYMLSEDQWPRTLNVGGGVPDGWTEAELIQSVEEVADRWNTLTCAGIELEVASGFDPTLLPSNDGLFTVLFEDPDDDLVKYSTSVMIPHRSSTVVMEQDGDTYYQLSDGDIILSAEMSWGTDADVTEATCINTRSLEDALSHNIGHMLGLGHSCEDGESCDTEHLQTALMHWSSVGECAASRPINADDETSLNALYGPWLSSDCGGDRDGQIAGMAPLELRCTTDYARTDDPRVDWSFGDGGTDNGLEIAHTYSEPGTYTVESCYSVGDGDCAGWSYCDAHSTVTVCGDLDPGFTVEPLYDDGYLLVNTTSPPEACVDDVRWSISQVGGSWSAEDDGWDFAFKLPEDGTYEVTLALSGLAGEAVWEETLELSAEEASETEDTAKGCGYIDPRHTPGGAGLLVLLAGVALRREGER